MKGWLPFLVLLTPCAAAHADDPGVTFGQKRIVRSFFRTALVNPDTAQWFFDTKRLDPRGTLICGRVNYQNSANIYVGEHRFYVILKPGVVASTEPEKRLGYYRSTNVVNGDIYDSPAEDPGGGLKSRLELLCGKR